MTTAGTQELDCITGDCPANCDEMTFQTVLATIATSTTMARIRANRRMKRLRSVGQLPVGGQASFSGHQGRPASRMAPVAAERASVHHASLKR